MFLVNIIAALPKFTKERHWSEKYTEQTSCFLCDFYQ